jgi:hypothetical protein
VPQHFTDRRAKGFLFRAAGVKGSKERAMWDRDKALEMHGFTGVLGRLKLSVSGIRVWVDGE